MNGKQNRQQQQQQPQQPSGKCFKKFFSLVGRKQKREKKEKYPERKRVYNKTSNKKWREFSGKIEKEQRIGKR